MVTILPEGHELKDRDFFELISFPIVGTLPTWCRHNLLEAYLGADKLWRFFDTYWSSSLSVYFEEDLGVIKFLGNLDDYRIVSEEDFVKYLDGDQIYIPMGGVSAKRYVRKDAEKNLDRMIENTEKEIETMERDMRSIADRLIWKRKDLYDLNLKKDPKYDKEY